jgi:hypothetical protein
MVALDIDDFVNAPMIYDIFFTNARLPCDMRLRLFIEVHPDGLTEQTGWPPSTIKEIARWVWLQFRRRSKFKKVVMCMCTIIEGNSVG